MSCREEFVGLARAERTIFREPPGVPKRLGRLARDPQRSSATRGPGTERADHSIGRQSSLLSRGVAARAAGFMAALPPIEHGPGDMVRRV